MIPFTNLISTEGRQIPCWMPLPGVYLAKSFYQTPQSAWNHMLNSYRGNDHFMVQALDAKYGHDPEYQSVRKALEDVK